MDHVAALSLPDYPLDRLISSSYLLVLDWSKQHSPYRVSITICFIDHHDAADYDVLRHEVSCDDVIYVGDYARDCIGLSD
jgi:hypothetical protein